MDNFLIETSWEVANKVGGIYTVLKEKAHYVKEKFGDNYLVVGPYLRDKGFQDFSQFTPKENFENIIRETEKYGIKMYYGEWLIDGRPKGFLIDFENLKSKINALKYELWEKYKIDSTNATYDYDEPIAWCKAVSVFLKIFSEHFSEHKIVFHFHEWLSGAAILFEEFKSPTIFTTHATVLGRSLAGVGVNFWKNLDSINPQEESLKLGIEAKYNIEKNSAQKATYFSVVSNILSIESEKFLGRKPDFILPNGLDFGRFSTVEEMAIAHNRNRERLREFALFFFAPYYKLDLKDSLIIFISGREEIKNKGIDVFIKALSKLNDSIKSQNKNVFVFVFVPSGAVEENHILENNLNIYEGIENKIEEISNELKSRLINYLIHKGDVSSEKLFTEEEFLEFKRMFNKIKKEKEIPLSTHLLTNNNQITKLLKESNLLNKKEDKVKIIYYPSYVSSTDGFLNLNYENAISGSHLGVFPSFYEPWGYTPLETAASGVLTITTDLAGFSNYLNKNEKINQEIPGIFTLSRSDKNDDEVVENLYKILFDIFKIDRTKRIENKFEARRLSEACDWKILIKNYYNLYNKAFEF